MSRLGRYWLFFVIIAVGLALSWGQVGRKTQRVLLDMPVAYLAVESDCRPWQAPCAALGEDRALVLGPAADGLLAAQHTGLVDADIVKAEAIALDANGVEVARQLLAMRHGVWPLQSMPVTARRVRLQVTTNRAATLAEFPLSPSR